MNLKALKLEIEDHIATITINRPKALNAINREVMSELEYLFSEGLETDKLKAIIITGSGDKAFIAGADITEFDGLSEEEGTSLSEKGHSTFAKIENCPVVVIAAINGFSLGGGNELAMACHIRIASDNAKFGQPEVNLGLIPGFGGTQRLIQFIGKSRAMELLLTGDMIDAPTALSYGLITHVCPLEELLGVARKLALKIGSKGPTAVSEIINLVNAFYDKNSDGLTQENKAFGSAIFSEESTEGVNAFFEKRKAVFKKYN